MHMYFNVEMNKVCLHCISFDQLTQNIWQFLWLSKLNHSKDLVETIQATQWNNSSILHMYLAQNSVISRANNSKQSFHGIKVEAQFDSFLCLLVEVKHRDAAGQCFSVKTIPKLKGNLVAPAHQVCTASFGIVTKQCGIIL